MSQRSSRSLARLSTTRGCSSSQVCKLSTRSAESRLHLLSTRQFSRWLVVRDARTFCRHNACAAWGEVSNAYVCQRTVANVSRYDSVVSILTNFNFLRSFFCDFAAVFADDAGALALGLVCVASCDDHAIGDFTTCAGFQSNTEVFSAGQEPNHLL